MKMSRNFNGKRKIGVLELSSTAIKALIGTPNDFKKDSGELGRFKKNIKPLFVRDYLGQNGKIDVEKYVKNLLPLIIDVLKWIVGFSPQGLRIVATGHYRFASNAHDLFERIKDEVPITLKKRMPPIELLAPTQESYYSFYSWMRTTVPNPEDQTTQEQYFYLNPGLSVDVGGGTTEITLIKGNNFDQTVSIPIGADILFDSILSTKYVDWLHFTKFVSSESMKLRKMLEQELTMAFPELYGLKFAVISGSNIIVEGGDELNSRVKRESKRITWWISERFKFLQDTIYPYLEKGEIIPDRHLRFFSLYIGLNILETITDHFELEEYFVNRANLRIGVFYDIIDTLKSTSY